jgi:hypothetical protein
VARCTTSKCCHCGADNVNTIGWVTAAPQRPSAARYNIDANGSEYAVTQLPWPALLVQFRGSEIQGGRISSKLPSGDEHLAIVQSRSRVKESRGPPTARRREQVRRGIENIDSREGAARGGKSQRYLASLFQTAQQTVASDLGRARMSPSERPRG